MNAQHQLLQHYNFFDLAKRALLGAIIAFTLLGLFVLNNQVSSDDPIHLESYLLVPFLFISIGGACGGTFYYLMEPVRKKGMVQKVMINILCFLVYVVGLWMSLVFGLSLVGLWN
jgi:hypothetical protein